MNASKSAGRYAKAILELVNEQDCLLAVEKDFTSFLQVVSLSDDLRIFLNSPVVRGDKKMSVLTRIFPDFNAMTLRFFALVVKNRRESHLIEMAHAFEELVQNQRGIVPGTITSSVPLSADTKALIIQKIASSFEGKLELTEEVDASLMGGFVVRVADKQLDASVSNKLNKLRQELVN
jgi:F-type H+-transporting ATPase subunit delta